MNRSFSEGIFGDLTKVVDSDMNPKWVARKLVEEQLNKPKIYMACGDKDILLEANRDFSSYLEDIGIDVTYEEGSGGHDWDFWDQYIKKVLNWLPLENNTVGINSGNVSIK